MSKETETSYISKSYLPPPPLPHLSSLPQFGDEGGGAGGGGEGSSGSAPRPLRGVWWWGRWDPKTATHGGGKSGDGDAQGRWIRRRRGEGTPSLHCLWLSFSSSSWRKPVSRSAPQRQPRHPPCDNDHHYGIQQMFLFSVENFQLAVKNMDVDLNVILNMNLHNFFLRTSTTDVRFNVNLHAVNNILLFLFFLHTKFFLQEVLLRSAYENRLLQTDIWPCAASGVFGRLRKYVLAACENSFSGSDTKVNWMGSN